MDKKEKQELKRRLELARQILFSNSNTIFEKNAPMYLEKQSSSPYEIKRRKSQFF